MIIIKEVWEENDEKLDENQKPERKEVYTLYTDNTHTDVLF